MALPEGFNPVEFLQDTVMKVQNRIVRDEFNDVGDDDWEADITTSRGALRVACTHQDSDSIDVTLTRLWLFYGCLRKASDFHPPIYGIPIDSYQQQVTFLPQIKLHFLENLRDVEPGFEAVEGEISFRLMHETPETMTPAKAQTLANKIRSLFAGSSGFIWKKGRVKVVYLDKEKGYDFRLLVTSETEGRRIVEQVLDIQNHSPDWQNLSIAESRANFPIIPPNHLVYGKQRRKPRRRPRADVHFKFAELHLHGLPNPIILVDRTGIYRHALLTA